MISLIYHFLKIIPYALIPIGFLTILVALPLWAMLNYQDMGLMWQEILADEYYRWRVEWTVFQATVTAILSAILGIPTAWALARLDFFGRKHFIIKWLIMILVNLAMLILVGMGAMHNTSTAFSCLINIVMFNNIVHFVIVPFVWATFPRE